MLNFKKYLKDIYDSDNYKMSSGHTQDSFTIWDTNTPVVLWRTASLPLQF